MMQLFARITDFFARLDKKQMQRLIMVAIGSAFVLLGLVAYFQYRQVQFFRREMITINNARIKVNEILERNEVLKQQQQHGEGIMAKDKNFYLKEHVNSIVSKLGLQNNFKGGPVSINDLENLRARGYEEVKMLADFVGINMRQLVELVRELELNERLDIKKIDIVKAKQSNAIDAQLSISTLQPKAESSLEFETE